MSVFLSVLSSLRRLQRPTLATLLVAGALVVGTVTAPPETAFAAPVCASPPLSGSTSVSGVVNGYFPGLSASVAAGQANTTVTLGSGVGASTPLAVDDLVLIMQMQGAEINATNTNAYGDGVAGGEARGNTSTNFLAGRYEYARVSSVTGSTIGLTGSGTNGGLVNSYQNSAATATSGQYRYQVIRVPQYSTAVLNPATPPTAAPWNGSTGGVVVLDAANTLDLNGATIDVTGLGFRPGVQRQRSGTSAGGFANTDYRTPTSAPDQRPEGRRHRRHPGLEDHRWNQRHRRRRVSERRLRTRRPRQRRWWRHRRQPRATTVRTPVAVAAATAASADAVATPGARTCRAAATAERRSPETSPAS